MGHDHLQCQKCRFLHIPKKIEKSQSQEEAQNTLM